MKIAVTPIHLLTLVFVTLKLTNNIDWSWWWVLSPMWIPLAIFAVIIVFALLLAGLAKLL